MGAAILPATTAMGVLIPLFPFRISCLSHIPVPSSTSLKTRNLKIPGNLFLPTKKTLFVAFLKNKPFLKVPHFFHVLPIFPPPLPLRSSTPLFPTGLQVNRSCRVPAYTVVVSPVLTYVAGTNPASPPMDLTCHQSGLELSTSMYL